MDWAQILVFVLAGLFAIFLIITIILIVLLVSISRQIKAAAASAERTANMLESSVSKFSKATLPAVVTKQVAGRILSIAKKKSSK